MPRQAPCGAAPRSCRHRGGPMAPASRRGCTRSRGRTTFASARARSHDDGFGAHLIHGAEHLREHVPFVLVALVNTTKAERLAGGPPAKTSTPCSRRYVKSRSRSRPRTTPRSFGPGTRVSSLLRRSARFSDPESRKRACGTRLPTTGESPHCDSPARARRHQRTTRRCANLTARLR